MQRVEMREGEEEKGGRGVLLIASGEIGRRAVHERAKAAMEEAVQAAVPRGRPVREEVEREGGRARCEEQECMRSPAAPTRCPPLTPRLRSSRDSRLAHLRARRASASESGAWSAMMRN